MRTTAVLAIAAIGVAIFLLLNSSGAGAPSFDTAVTMTQPITTLDSRIITLANAIAQAEGYGVSGAVPSRANNPGDLVLGDVGNGTANSAGVTIYSTLADGWNALYNELNLIFSGASHVYSVAMSFSDMADKWTGGDNATAWASIVAGALGVTADTSLDDWYNGAAS